ncbi:Hypothetical protein D9617_24g016310 [Elsinoe fawcettii]|nr:Hypothetical protein D9617_24g016310 [Elsinoe fawcettii]
MAANYLAGARLFVPPFQDETTEGMSCNLAVIHDLCCFNKDIEWFHPDTLERYADLAEAYGVREVKPAWFTEHQTMGVLHTYQGWLNDAAKRSRQAGREQGWANAPLCCFTAYPIKCQQYITRALGAEQLSKKQQLAISDQIKNLNPGSKLNVNQLTLAGHDSASDLLTLDDLVRVLHENNTSRRYDACPVDMPKIFKAFGLILPPSSDDTYKLINGLLTHYTSPAGGMQLMFRHCELANELCEAVAVAMDRMARQPMYARCDHTKKLWGATEWAYGHVAKGIQPEQE